MEAQKLRPIEENEFKELVRDAMTEVSFFSFRVRPGFLKLRQVFKKNDYTWIVGFWAKSYGPEIEIIQTSGSTPRSLRAMVVSGIEENLRQWIKIADDRDKLG